MSSPPKSSKVAAGCFLLFALPFAAVGVVMAWMVGAAVWNRVEMIGWVETPAEILAVGLETRDGEDGPVYEVNARYAYRFGGKRFVGERVGIHTGADNIGSFHRDAYRELEAYRRTARPARCWVDPRDPSRAILIREIRWRLLTFEIIFGVVFGGVGFGLLIAFRYGRRALLEEGRRRQLYPDQPWMWREDWARGRVRSAGRATLIMPIAVAVVANSLCLLAAIFAIDEVRRGNWAAALAFVFAPVGVWLAIRALRAAKRWRRFGASELELESTPIPRGGALRGTLLAAATVGVGTDFDLTLSCVRARGSDDGEKVLWQDRRTVPGSRVAGDGSRLRVPVEIEVPAEVPTSKLDERGGKIEWRLDAAAAPDGVDYEARFELPVFGRAEAEPAPGFDERSATDAHRALREAGLQVEPMSAGGTRFVVPRRRHPKVALTLGAVLGIFAVVGAVLVRKSAPAALVWLLGMTALVILIATLEVWLRESRIEAGPRGLVLRSGLLGPGRPRFLEPAEIDGVLTVRGLQAGNRLYHRVVVVDRNGKKRVAATGLESLALARHLATAIEAELGAASAR